MVEYLLAAGADTEKAESHGYTPLYIASEKNHVERFKLL
jgi:ankyrin repeat protein